MNAATFTQANAALYECPKCYRVNFEAADVVRLYCPHCKVGAEELRDEPVTLFAHLSPTPLCRRDCFSLAILTLLEHNGEDQARLVHGWVRDSFHPGEFIEHAWCEFPATATYNDGSEGDIVVVVDYSQLDARSRIVPVEVVYKLIGLDETRVKRYTLHEALVNALSAGHDGPWPNQPELATESSGCSFR